MDQCWKVKAQCHLLLCLSGHVCRNNASLPAFSTLEKITLQGKEKRGKNVKVTSSFTVVVEGYDALSRKGEAFP